MAPSQVPNDARTVAPTEPTTHLLDVPGAVLAYDVRIDATSTSPCSC
jgi:hypothetical protein